VLLEGYEADVGQVIEWCHIGPPKATVNDVDIKYESYTGEFEEFMVNYWIGLALFQGLKFYNTQVGAMNESTLRPFLMKNSVRIIAYEQYPMADHIIS